MLCSLPRSLAGLLVLSWLACLPASLFSNASTSLLKCQPAGVTREQLDLSLEGRSLALRVTQAEGASADDEPVLKSWELPEDIELDGISSKLSDNELVITLPKKKAQVRG